MKIKTIKASDIAACPRKSFDPKHYRDDGSCKCVKRPIDKMKAPSKTKPTESKS
jgi:hypothetical protein